MVIPLFVLCFLCSLLCGVLVWASFNDKFTSGIWMIVRVFCIFLCTAFFVASVFVSRPREVEKSSLQLYYHCMFENIEKREGKADPIEDYKYHKKLQVACESKVRLQDDIFSLMHLNGS